MSCLLSLRTFSAERCTGDFARYQSESTLREFSESDFKFQSILLANQARMSRISILTTARQINAFTTVPCTYRRRKGMNVASQPRRGARDGIGQLRKLTNSFASRNYSYFLGNKTFDGYSVRKSSLVLTSTQTSNLGKRLREKG